MDACFDTIIVREKNRKLRNCREMEIVYNIFKHNYIYKVIIYMTFLYYNADQLETKLCIHFSVGYCNIIREGERKKNIGILYTSYKEENGEKKNSNV